MQLCHAVRRGAARFDDPGLVSAAGLVPAVAVAQRAGLSALAQEHLSVPGGAGCVAGAKVSGLVAGMVAGADSIDDMDLLRHGAMPRLVTGVRAPSTLGTFLRAFRFGHVRQLDAVAARFLAALFSDSPLPLLTAEGDHCRHAIVEQVIAELKNGPLAHLPSGRFAANSAWLVLAAMAVNLTCALGALASTLHAKATLATVRTQLVAVPARVATSARRSTLHLPLAWPWATVWQQLFIAMTDPPAAA